MPEVTREPPGRGTDLIMCCVTGFSSKSSGRRWPKSRDKVSDFSKPCDFGQEVKCPGYVWQKASSAINAELPFNHNMIALSLEVYQYDRNVLEKVQ